ncbi:triose-phosphate isomerase [Candidatus Woesearchaeota archaeon]|nr:triose-phosphate isomerase [Candidatus Woesearchaeota archaeon]
MGLDTPVLVINFKTYETATAKKAEELAKICEKAAKQNNKSIVVVVQNTDLYRVSKKVGIPVFAQHVDDAKLGKSTGKTTSLAVKEDGARGVLINHSEDRTPLKTIRVLIDKCRAEGLLSLVCARTSGEAKKIAYLKPDFLAIEPPELIGGDVSVSTAKPEVISKSVKLVNKVNSEVNVLCGAGVKTSEDVSKALELGAKGVLLASGVTKAVNPEETINDLLKGLN